MAKVSYLKSFVYRGRRYSVVYGTSTKEKAEKVRQGLYGNKLTALHYDTKRKRWLIGVRR